MVKYSQARLNATFAALADPTRRMILSHLANGEATVGELAKPFNMSWPAVTKHLKVLESAHLVEREREGRVHRIRLATAPMKEALDWLDRYRKIWDRRMGRLADFPERTSTSIDMEGKR
jgi:DNA-binding transcriptional ArsR family regulator